MADIDRVEFTIVALPKGGVVWKYWPIQPTHFKVKRQGGKECEERCSIQSPFALGVGDTAIFDSLDAIPAKMVELTRANSTRPAYAIIKVIERIEEQKEVRKGGKTKQQTVEFVK